MCSSLQDGLPIFIWSMKRQTCATEDTQTLPTTSPDSQKFDKTKCWKHKKMHFRCLWSHLPWIYCTVFNCDIIPVMTTKYLFRQAWNHAFLGWYLLMHQRVNAFFQRLVRQEMCSKQICMLLYVQRDRGWWAVSMTQLTLSCTSKVPFFLQISPHFLFF